MKRIEHAIQFRDINITHDNSYIKPVKKSRRLKLNTLPTIVQKIPPPNEGKEYSPDEVVSILSPYPEQSTNKYQLIKHILKETFIPLKSIGSVYKLLSRHKDGKYI